MLLQETRQNWGLGIAVKQLQNALEIVDYFKTTLPLTVTMKPNLAPKREAFAKYKC